MNELPRKKEVTIEFELYKEELQNALNQGVNAGYTQALQTLIRYLKDEKEAKEFFTSEPHELWQYVFKSLGKEKEWEEYLKVKEEKEKQKEESKIKEC
jgi:hypothetical protein